MGTDGNLALVAAPHVGAPAPDEGLAGTGRSRAEHAAVVSERRGFSGVRRGPECAVDCVFVGVGHQWVEPGVGPGERAYVFGGAEGGPAFLPVVMAALDFAFGLGGGRVVQGDAVEREGGPQLGAGVGIVGVEEGVEVHVAGQWPAVGLAGAGEEVEVSQQGFPRGRGGPRGCGAWRRRGCLAGLVGRGRQAARRAGWPRIARAHQSRELASV